MRQEEVKARSRWPLLAVFLLLLAMPALGGCQHVIKPPTAVSDPVQVFVVDYGRHASLALPDGGARLVEWSWGDWNWFARQRTGVGSGLQALFASSQSTLSRRELGTVADGQELSRRLGAQEVLALEVERERADALLRELEARWRRTGPRVPHADGRAFAPDHETYGLFNNSVHELVRWLRALGAEVSGSGVTANFALRNR